MYDRGRCETPNGPTQSIQERKVICHCVEKEQENISHPPKHLFGFEAIYFQER